MLFATDGGEKQTSTYGVLLRRHVELVAGVQVTPHALHVLPVHHDAVLDGVAPAEGAPVLLQLVPHAHVRPFQCPPRHHADVLGPPNRRGENHARPVPPGKARLEHARAVVNDNGLVRHAVHGCRGWWVTGRRAVVELKWFGDVGDTLPVHRWGWW